MPISGKRVKQTRLIRGGKYVVVVEVEMVLPADDPSEPCYEPETVQLLREIKEHVDKNDVNWMNEHGRVFDIEALKSQISSAFSNVAFPGDWCLREGNEGDEPFLLEREFQGKTNWHVLAPEFLDGAPDGFASALSFFSDEAFRFYLPAYLIADINGRLERQDPAFHLTHGLTNKGRSQRVNQLRYGERTWFEDARHKFAIFDRTQAEAIVTYLRFKAETDEFLRDDIDQALRNFWIEKASSGFE